MAKFRVAKNDEVPAEAVILCIRADMYSPYDDNVRGVCSHCGEAVVHRPHVPPGHKLICLVCYQELAEDDDEHSITDRTLQDVREFFRPIRKKE